MHGSWISNLFFLSSRMSLSTTVMPSSIAQCKNSIGAPGPLEKKRKRKREQVPPTHPLSIHSNGVLRTKMEIRWYGGASMHVKCEPLGWLGLVFQLLPDIPGPVAKWHLSPGSLPLLQLRRHREKKTELLYLFLHDWKIIKHGLNFAEFLILSCTS